MSNAPSSVFITGATGLIGAHLLSQLLDTGAHVRALKRPTSNLDTVRKILGYYHTDPEAVFSRVEWIDGNLNDVSFLRSALAGCEAAYHCAGMVSFDPRDRQQLFQVNVEGTASVVEACLHAGKVKLCYLSSASTLGKPTQHSASVFIDEQTPWNPSGKESDYGLSKFKAEQEVWKGVEKGLSAVILNPTIVIGPGDWDRSSSRLIQTIWKGFPFYSAGANAFVDVRDVARLAVRLTDAGLFGERFVVSAENLAFKTLFDSIADHLHVKRPWIKVSPLLGGIAWRADWLVSKLSGAPRALTRSTVSSAKQRYEFSNAKITRALDYSFIPISQSVEDTCALFRSEHGK